jgi:hypothetical protein
MPMFRDCTWGPKYALRKGKYALRKDVNQVNGARKDARNTPLYSVTGVNAEHRLIARIVPLENAWAPFAFLTLTFLRNRREHFRRIDFVKLVDQDAIRDRLRQRLEDGGVDGSDDGST